jgi:hypothetical protein
LTDDFDRDPPRHCPLLGEDITKIFHNVFELDNKSAPQFFDLRHFGVKPFHQLGWYMMNSSHMIKYLKQKELF